MVVYALTLTVAMLAVIAICTMRFFEAPALSGAALGKIALHLRNGPRHIFVSAKLKTRECDENSRVLCQTSIEHGNDIFCFQNCSMNESRRRTKVDFKKLNHFSFPAKYKTREWGFFN